MAITYHPALLAGRDYLSLSGTVALASSFRAVIALSDGVRLFQNFTGTSGNDHIAGTNAPDTFDMAQGGNDRVTGKAGNDTFNFGATLTAQDRIDGGSQTSSDVVVLDGDYSTELVLADNTIVDIEQLRLTAGNNYAVTFADGNLASGARLIVTANEFSAANWVHLDASAETDARFALNGGPGDDILVGGQVSDTLNPGSGTNTVDGGGGSSDVVSFASIFITSGVTVDLGIVGVAQDVGPSIVTLLSIESIRGSIFDDLLIGDHANNNISTQAGSDTMRGGGGDDALSISWLNPEVATVVRAIGGDGIDVLSFYEGVQTLSAFVTFRLESMRGSSMSADKVKADGIENVEGSWGEDSLTGDGANNILWGADDEDVLRGGEGDDQLFGDQSRFLPVANPAFDVLTGGDGDDLLNGGAAGDQISGENGSDTIAYETASDSFTADIHLSPPNAVDTLIKFDARDDFLQLWFQVTAIDDPVTSGGLSDESYNDDLEEHIDASTLADGHAILFKPDSGDYDGSLLLIVSTDGNAGFQAGDMVIDITGAKGMSAFSISNFVT